MLELPIWWPEEVWPCVNARGLGLRFGEVGMGEGEGVRAKGDNGILWTDLRRCGDFMLWVRLLWCNPCNELGLPNVELLAGELGELELAELFEELPSEESGDQGIAPGKDFVAFSCPLLLSPQVQDLLNAPLPRDRPVTIKGEVDQSVFLDLELNLRRMDLPLVFSLIFSSPFFLLVFRTIFPGCALRFPPLLMVVLSIGTQRMLTTSPPFSMFCMTLVYSRLCTGSSLIWVINMPGRNPLSYAGLFCSTAWKMEDIIFYKPLHIWNATSSCSSKIPNYGMHTHLLFPLAPFQLILLSSNDVF